MIFGLSRFRRTNSSFVREKCPWYHALHIHKLGAIQVMSVDDAFLCPCMKPVVDSVWARTFRLRCTTGYGHDERLVAVSVFGRRAYGRNIRRYARVVRG